jgi:hypothetical protein
MNPSPSLRKLHLKTRLIIEKDFISYGKLICIAHSYKHLIYQTISRQIGNYDVLPGLRYSTQLYVDEASNYISIIRIIDTVKVIFFIVSLLLLNRVVFKPLGTYFLIYSCYFIILHFYTYSQTDPR